MGNNKQAARFMGIPWRQRVSSRFYEKIGNVPRALQVDLVSLLCLSPALSLSLTKYFLQNYFKRSGADSRYLPTKEELEAVGFGDIATKMKWLHQNFVGSVEMEYKTRWTKKKVKKQVHCLVLSFLFDHFVLGVSCSTDR